MRIEHNRIVAGACTSNVGLIGQIMCGCDFHVQFEIYPH